MLSRRAVGRGLVVYWLVLWAAVILQIDQFPLTWVPMYAKYNPQKPLQVRVTGRDTPDTGLRVTYRDGSTGSVNRTDLNLTKRHFRRLFRQRLFQGHVAEAWPYRVLRSLNRTLGREPDDPDFIVGVDAEVEVWTARRSDLHVEHETRHAVHVWLPEYDERWNREGD